MGCRVVVAGCTGAGAREVEGSDDDDAADASVVDGNVVAVEMKLRESSQMLVGQRLKSHSNDRSWRVPV